MVTLVVCGRAGLVVAAREVAAEPLHHVTALAALEGGSQQGGQLLVGVSGEDVQDADSARVEARTVEDAAELLGGESVQDLGELGLDQPGLECLDGTQGVGVVLLAVGTESLDGGQDRVLALRVVGLLVALVLVGLGVGSRRLGGGNGSRGGLRLGGGSTLGRIHLRRLVVLLLLRVRGGHGDVQDDGRDLVGQPAGLLVELHGLGGVGVHGLHRSLPHVDGLVLRRGCGAQSLGADIDGGQEVLVALRVDAGGRQVLLVLADEVLRVLVEQVAQSAQVANELTGVVRHGDAFLGGRVAARFAAVDNSRW